MKDIIKSILCLLITHIFAGLGYFITIIIALVVFNVYPKYTIIFFMLIYIIVFGRLLVLPIAYNILENSQNFKLASKFIKKLKKSPYLKIIILVISYFSYWPFGIPWFDDGFDGQLMTSVVFGLLGNYIILFLYWFIQDKIRNKINKRNS